MTIRRLRTLLAVADTKTFSAAAEVVHVTHAAVSQQMQALETDLGVVLFDRSTRTPTLTPVAHQIIAKARRLISDYDNLVPSVLNDTGLSGTITLGVLRTTLTGLTPQAMAALKSRYPGMGLHIRPGLTATLLAEIERGNLDAAITSRPYQLPRGVVFHDLAKEPMTLIAALEENETDPITLLRSRPFIRFDRTAVVGSLIDNWLLAHDIKVNETMELDSPEAITEMVRANLGVSIVPKPAVPPRDAIPVSWIALGADTPFRTLGLVHRKDAPKAEALTEIRRALRSVIDAASTLQSDHGT